MGSLLPTELDAPSPPGDSERAFRRSSPEPPRDAERPSGAEADLPVAAVAEGLVLGRPAAAEAVVLARGALAELRAEQLDAALHLVRSVLRRDDPRGTVLVAVLDRPDGVAERARRAPLHGPDD